MKHHYYRRVRHLLSLIYLLLSTVIVWARPVVTALAPASGSVGTTVTITGTGFAATAAQNAVYFDAVRATVTTASPTQLQVQVPGGVTSAAVVTVINTADGQQGTSLASGAGTFRVTFTGGTLGLSTFRRTDVSLGLPTGLTGPRGPVVTADFNQDGKLDVLTVVNNLIIVYGDGNGDFGAPLVLSAGFSPASAAVADFTGDGQLDIVALNGGSQDVSLLVGLGMGGFATAQTIYSNNTNERLQSMVAQDLDSDGRVDLLLTLFLNNTFQQIVLRNSGSGFSVTPVTVPGLGVPLAADDFNSDNQPDLVGLVNTTGPSGQLTSLNIWRRNAANTGYLVPEATPAVPAAFVQQLTVGDVNLDGLRDVVVASTNAQLFTLPINVYVWRRNASNTGFEPADVYTLPGDALAGLRLADADGDGAVDIILATASRISVFRNDGTGTAFATPVGYNNSNGTRLLGGAGDFNGDGRTDFLAQNVNLFGNFDSSLFLNTGNATGNNPPTLAATPNLTIDEDSAPVTVPLSGISNGGDAGQAVTITAVSSDPALIPNPTISYISPTSTGTLRLQPTPDAFGTVTITVTVADGQAQNGTTTRSFQVTINPVNDPPTLDPISDIVVTTTLPGFFTVPLSGITSGAANENQILLVSSTTLGGCGSGLDSQVSYVSPATTGTVRVCVPTVIPIGLVATVTLTVDDGQRANNSVSRTFRVYYQPNASGAAPTLAPIADVTANRSLATQVPVALTGIDGGNPNQILPLTVTATSSDPALVTLGGVNYTSPATTGNLPYTISNIRGGTAVVSVTVSNGQSLNGTITRTFRVTVPQPIVNSAVAGRTSVGMSLYPNPSRDGRFTLEADASGPVMVSIIDLMGREVWRQSLPALPKQLLLHPAGLRPSGVYIVRLTTSQGTSSRRLMVE